MSIETLKTDLCRAFCATINVRAVPVGFAVSTVFSDRSGDPISFYVVEDGDDLRVEDDGDYLASLIFKDVPINEGQRAQLLDAILAEAYAYWDRETYEIKTEPFPPSRLATRALDFVSALIRVRDLELLTREIVRSTFREDAGRELVRRFGKIADITENAPISRELGDYPADFVVRPTVSAERSAAIYLVNSNDKLNEALLLHMELMQKGQEDVVVVGLIEDPDMRTISHRRFQRGQNKSLALPIFRGDEAGAMELIAGRMRLGPATATH